ncbi:PKAR [Symbiodinium natans]|uniref:PKAR protein n=1 Tax=Symbiodinium natans TaxID=878477 RepID=A0A812MH91_9DINO|nr:PKAR [Symbiodinium natans]
MLTTQPSFPSASVTPGRHVTRNGPLLTPMWPPQRPPQNPLDGENSNEDAERFKKLLTERDARISELEEELNKLKKEAKPIQPEGASADAIDTSPPKLGTCRDPEPSSTRLGDECCRAAAVSGGEECQGKKEAQKPTQVVKEELGLNKTKLVKETVGAHELVVKSPRKNAGERQLIMRALKSTLSTQAQLKFNQIGLEQIIDVAWKESIPTGKEIISEGDLIVDHFYICQSGSFEIYVADTRKGQGGRKLVRTVTSGGSFGEIALFNGGPQSATVIAQEDSSVWVVDGRIFMDSVVKASQESAMDSPIRLVGQGLHLSGSCAMSWPMPDEEWHADIMQLAITLWPLPPGYEGDDRPDPIPTHAAVFENRPLVQRKYD